MSDMPLWASWLLFALVALSTIMGAKALDDRDRRRFASRASGARVPSGAVPTSEPPSGAFPHDGPSMEPDEPPSSELALPQ